jgi:tungstate transport system substrate-binding protein
MFGITRASVTRDRRVLALSLSLVLILALVAGMSLFVAACGSGDTTTTVAPQTTTTAAPQTTTTAAAAKTSLVLASTTSTKDSGLFDVLIPAFTAAYPQYDIKVVAVGSGEALKQGETGDADVLLVHSPAAEETFMKDGFGVDRKAVMYNDFVIVGPAADPAGIKGATVVADAFKKIADSASLFYSRGDKSGTNTKELALWKAAAITPAGAWYQSTGQGMGETLTIADQKGGYTLTDRATWLAKKDALKGLALLVEGDKALFNQYHVITSKAAKNTQGAVDFMNWIVSADVQQNIIAKFGIEKFGQALFIPNADTAK